MHTSIDTSDLRSFRLGIESTPQRVRFNVRLPHYPLVKNIGLATLVSLGGLALFAKGEMSGDVIAFTGAALLAFKTNGVIFVATSRLRRLAGVTTLERSLEIPLFATDSGAPVSIDGEPHARDALRIILLRKSPRDIVALWTERRVYIVDSFTMRDQPSAWAKVLSEAIHGRVDAWTPAQAIKLDDYRDLSPKGTALYLSTILGSVFLLIMAGVFCSSPSRPGTWFVFVTLAVAAELVTQEWYFRRLANVATAAYAPLFQEPWRARFLDATSSESAATGGGPPNRVTPRQSGS